LLRKRPTPASSGSPGERGEASWTCPPEEAAEDRLQVLADLFSDRDTDRGEPMKELLIEDEPNTVAYLRVFRF
jgi:hypothetical protein